MTNIPLPKPKAPDIYSFGFDKNLNRLGNTPQQSSTVYDGIGGGVNTGQLSSQGIVTPAGGLVKVVSPNENLQAAMDALSQTGGGVIQLLISSYTFTVDINVPSNITIVGAGRDQTILRFQNDAQLRIDGTAALVKNNIKLQNMTVLGSNDNVVIGVPAINVNFADFVTFENVLVEDGRYGFFLKNCRDIIFNNVTADNNSDYGYIFAGSSSTRSINRILMNNCIASNSNYGFLFEGATGFMSHFTLINCKAITMSFHGFFVSNGSSTPTHLFGTFLGCSADGCQVGFYITRSHSSLGKSWSVNCVSCFADNCTAGGFDFNNGENCTAVGCFSSSGYYPGRGNNIMISGFLSSATVNPLTGFFFGGVPAEGRIDGIARGSTRTKRIYFSMKNTSGAVMRLGNVVILKSVATGDEVTTTSTNGDKKVFGMVHGGSSLSSGVGLVQIDNDAWGEVLTEGYTSNLYADNGAASIVIGDFLSAYSHAYYAKKAVTGEMAFAIALSTPTTGTASIEALLISPRLI